MERGLYAAATGMMAQQAMQDVLAQNIANASTLGYKQNTPTFRTIQSMTLQRLNDGHGRGPTIGELGTGVKSDKVYIDWQTGPLSNTGGALDASLGDGQFFAVQTPQGERYTRAGDLQVDGGGNLVTSGGLRVLNSNGQPIVAPKIGTVKLDSSGNLVTENAIVAKLKIVQIDTAQIQKSGDNLFQAPPAAVRLAARPVVRPGTLEQSNMNTIQGLIRMITVSRGFDMSQRAITTQDDLLKQATTEIGKV